MKKIFLLFFPVFLGLITSLTSQDLSYGFRAGLSFSQIDGPLETGEAYDMNTGFHIGFGLGMWFTDIWGARAELVYSQKGAKYSYDGPSYLMMVSRQNRELTFNGVRKTSLTINNSYIDLPVTVFARPLRWLEISAGMYAGFLVLPSGTGEMQFNSNGLDPISIELDYNYYADKAREGSDNTVLVKAKASIDEFDVSDPAGAYYFQAEKKANLYRTLDFGATAGISFYLNRGLHLGARILYGMADITNTDADFSTSALEGNQPVSRSDKDQNLIYQASVGFNF